MGRILPFIRQIGGTNVSAQNRKPARGEVYIFPCGDDGGCWGVDHVSASGNSHGLIGTYFTLAEAEREAEAAAKRLNARYMPGIAL